MKPVRVWYVVISFHIAFFRQGLPLAVWLAWLPINEALAPLALRPRVSHWFALCKGRITFYK